MILVTRLAMVLLVAGLALGCSNDDTAPPPAAPAEDTEATADPGGADPGPGLAADPDGDGLLSSIDNCPAVANLDQSDQDTDGLGDACDPDRDGDGIDNNVDCAPDDPERSPAAPERCDGIDNDCDAQVDEANAQGCVMAYADADTDGAGPTASATCLCTPNAAHPARFGGDCADDDPAVGPYAVELCNGADEDCDGLVDEGCDDDQDGWCDALMIVTPQAVGCPNGGGDCLDDSADVHPGAVEVPGNFLDDDCDGTKAGDGAGPPPPDCTGEPCTGQSIEALLCGLDLCYPGLDVVQGAAIESPSDTPTADAWSVVSHFGSATNDLAPKAGSSYVLLATGPALGTDHNVTLGGGPVPDPYAVGVLQTYDNVEIALTLTAPDGVVGFSLRYVFFSVEYEEFVGKVFNDRFYIVLTAPTTTGGYPSVINAAACSNPQTVFDFAEGGEKWCFIAVNSVFSEACPAAPTDIGGTGFECAPIALFDGPTTGSSTGWLETSWPIEPGETFELRFHVHDTGDGGWDSEVILDDFRWETETFVPGTVASYN